MRDRVFLALYLAGVLGATLVHDPRILAAGVVLTGLLAGRDALRLARRAALAVLFFTGLVTISYVAIAAARGALAWRFVLLLNLRVFLLAQMAFLLQARINPFRALAFSPLLVQLVTLSYSQITTFRRLFADFRLALRSRSLASPRLRDLYRHGAATAAFFLGKALRDTTEITQAMTARGFHHDQG
jgi:cobalt/nickel transport system permease protein